MHHVYTDNTPHCRITAEEGSYSSVGFVQTGLGYKEDRAAHALLYPRGATLGYQDKPLCLLQDKWSLGLY